MTEDASIKHRSTTKMDAEQLVQGIENTHWRSTFRLLLSAEAETRTEGLRELSRGIGFRGALEKEFLIGGPDAARVIEIAMTTDLPARATPGYTSEQIIQWFWEHPDPALIPGIARAYAVAPPKLQGGALAVLAVIATVESVNLIHALLNQHGVPSGMYYRFFSEIGKHLDVNAPLLPDLVVHTLDGEFLASAVDLINEAIDSGYLDSNELSPHKHSIENAAKRLLVEAGERRHSSDASQYRQVRASLGASLDVLARVSDTSISLLREAQAFDDPRIVMVASTVLLRRGVDSPESVWGMIAASDECREPLYRVLDGNGRLDLFPREYLTVDAFAAANMVGWLSYPSELGHAPSRMEKMARLSSVTDDGEQLHFLWRFSDGDKQYAGVSGPYPADAKPGPLHGSDTFSNFAEWDSASPEAHFESIVETLTRWSVEWCK